MCGWRHGETRTAPRCGTCSWPTTSGTRPRSVQDEGAVQLRPRRPARPGRDPAAGRVAVPAAGPGRRPGRDRAGSAGLALPESRPLGRHLVLDALWRRLGIDRSWPRLLTGRTPRPRAERVLFALVANRALAPSSKLAAAGWVSRRRAHRRPGRRARRRLLPGDGLAARDRSRRWSEEVYCRSPTCSTSKSTCCSSTPPPPTSRLDEADEPVCRATSTAAPPPGRRRRRPTRQAGQARVPDLRQVARTTATTCPRS